jgi:hypothetical protein
VRELWSAHLVELRKIRKAKLSRDGEPEQWSPPKNVAGKSNYLTS